MCDDSEAYARNITLSMTYGRLPSFCFFTYSDVFHPHESTEWWKSFSTSTDTNVAYFAKRWTSAHECA